MTTNAECFWCEMKFEQRRTGGKLQRFCSSSCRKEFYAKCRSWAASKAEAGQLPISVLKRIYSNVHVASEQGNVLVGTQTLENGQQRSPGVLGANGHQAPLPGDTALGDQRAFAGDGDIQVILTLAYAQGTGVEQNLEKLREWLEAATGRGDIAAISVLGLMLLTE